MEFKGANERTNVDIDIMILTKYGLEKVGDFNIEQTNPKLPRLTFLPKEQKADSDDIKDQLFKVIISQVNKCMVQF